MGGQGKSLTFKTTHTYIVILLLHLLAATATLISVPDITGKKTYFRHYCPSSLFLPLSEINAGGEVTHSVTTGWVQHGSWSTEQAEELGAPPLLCWQVPAWIDHLQRQQRSSHRLENGQRRKGKMSVRKLEQGRDGS